MNDFKPDYDSIGIRDNSNRMERSLIKCPYFMHDDLKDIRSFVLQMVAAPLPTRKKKNDNQR